MLLGPGLVTGAADDDPSGTATYSSVGAQFGYSMLWTMFFIYPFMAGIQEISARLGRITGHGIAGNIQKYYPQWIAIGARNHCTFGLDQFTIGYLLFVIRRRA